MVTFDSILRAIEDDYETRGRETVMVAEELRVEVNGTRKAFDPVIYSRMIAKRKREERRSASR